ncbi:MAG TPA: 23S rRNA (adenine(2503)-C(2))-methyltransferase RlmN [Sedimentisphaerales bacterium]|nr:23S rRNA (adenine(2503)-C(2))-methyltransferase RlmN [Sedimentisphaerales bacterium]
MAQDLKDKTLSELEGLVVGMGRPKYLARYIFSFIHRHGVTDISQITPLSRAFREKLSQNGFHISNLKTVRTFEDPDRTIKYLFELQDGNRIEAVLLSDGGRKTACISTQAGCAMNCAFCATAKLKFRRNLTAAEIVDQVNAIHKEGHKISNVVYMGMGEPLENYEAVVRSVRILNHPAGWNIGIRHLTISTCGIPPAIEKLACEDVHPRLAISLNAPADSLRTKLMPINSKYPIAAIINAVKVYQMRTRGRVTFEYVLIKGLNDKVMHAGMLAKLLAGLRCNVNLIEYNPHPGCQSVASGKEAIERFAGTLEKAGIETVIRFKKGQRIKAGCGQLGADWLSGPPEQG